MFSSTSVNSGLQSKSIPSTSTFLRAMAIALTACLLLLAQKAVTIIRRPARANDEVAPASTLASVLPAALSCCPSVSSVVRRS